MARRQIRPRADHDLDSIWSFIAADNAGAADAMIDRLTDTFEMLLTMPQAGRTRHEFGVNLRSFTVHNYVIFYVTVPEGIDIVRVVHGRQDIGPRRHGVNLTPLLPRSPDRRDGSFRRGR